MTPALKAASMYDRLHVADVAYQCDGCDADRARND